MYPTRYSFRKIRNGQKRNRKKLLLHNMNFSIEINDLTFRYKQDYNKQTEPVFKNLSLNFEKGKTDYDYQ